LKIKRLSQWEETFALQLRAARIAAPAREYVFDQRENRKWRFDFAWPYQRIAVEIHGGTHIKGGGRHNRQIGADAEKANSAQLQGWDVYTFTSDHVKSGYALGVIEEAILNEKRCHGGG